MTEYKIYLTNNVNNDTITIKADDYDIDDKTTKFYVDVYRPSGRHGGRKIVLEVFNNNIVYIQKM